VTLPGATGPVGRIAAGEGHSFALTTTGQLYAFGYNAFGELGLATNAATNNPNPTPTLVGLPAGTTVEAISSGPAALHSLVVVSDLAVRSTSLPFGRVGQRYRAALTGAGGLAPYAWSAHGLGRGLSIESQSGLLSGVPRLAGTFTAAIAVADANGIVAAAPFALRIGPAGLLRAASVKGSTVKLTLGCPGTGPACPGNAIITVRERKRGGRITAILARRPGGLRTATAIVGRRPFTIPAGRTATVRIALNPTGKRLLARFQRLRARLAVTITGARQTRVITFHASKKRHRRR
jgi:hypothetical protein